jgi:putative hydrolase of the HAD superfamily
MSPLTTIGFDADDTLWENEVYYQAAKRRFAAQLSFACPEERSLAALDEIEVRNVDVYGYGIKSFSLSMIEAAARRRLSTRSWPSPRRCCASRSS